MGFLLLSYLHSFTQVDSVLSVKLIYAISNNTVDFTTDNLGNIYFLQNNNQLKKVNSKGDSIAVYNNVKRYGPISSIDATNPLKVLVFYKDFSTIVVLDRLLNIRNTIDLRRQQIFQVQAITTSYDNNIWVFDEQNSKLKKIDEAGKAILETSDFRQVFDKVPQPQVMYDRDGQLYMYDSARGILVFDYYGAYKKTIPLTHVKDIQVIDKNNIVARDNSHLLLYKPATFQSFSYTAFSNLHEFRKVIFNGSDIYALTKTGSLAVYQVK